jgi:Tfp pilus assembly protein PilO
VIYVTILLLVILVYRFAFYSPKVKEIKQKQGQYDQLYNEIINLTPKVTDDKYAVALEELDLAREIWKKLKGHLSNEMGNPNLLYDELINLSESKGNNLNIYETGRRSLTKVDGFVEKLSFDITLTGEFMNIVSFFYSLSTLQNIINAEEFTIEPLRGKEATVNLSLKGTFSAYKFNTD